MIKKILISPIIAVGIIAGLTILLLSKKARKEWLQDSEYAEFFSKRI